MTKIKIKTTLLILTTTGIFLFTHCSKENNVEKKFWPPDAWSVAVMLSTNVISYNADEVLLDMDVAVLDGSQSLTEDTMGIVNIPNNSFVFFDLANFDYEIQNIEYSTPTTKSDLFSTAILIDQSSSYQYIDEKNERFESINAFMQNVKPGNEFLIAAFARDGSLENEVSIYGNGFTDNWQDVVFDLLDLTEKTGGTSNLYDALAQLIDYVSANAANTNKSIVALIRNDDDQQSLTTLDSVISKAAQQSVKINIVWLYDQNYDFNAQTLRKLSWGTGGFTVATGIIKQANTIFMSLNRLLKNQFNFYRINLKMNAINYSFFPGFWIGHSFLVKDPSDEVFFYFELE